MAWGSWPVAEPALSKEVCHQHRTMMVVAPSVLCACWGELLCNLAGSRQGGMVHAGCGMVGVRSTQSYHDSLSMLGYGRIAAEASHVASGCSILIVCDTGSEESPTFVDGVLSRAPAEMVTSTLRFRRGQRRRSCDIA